MKRSLSQFENKSHDYCEYYKNFEIYGRKYAHVYFLFILKKFHFR